MFGGTNPTVIDLAEQDYHYGDSVCYNPNTYNPPVTNITYGNDKLKINANINPNQMACFGIGCIVGAALGLYLYKRYNTSSNV